MEISYGALKDNGSLVRDIQQLISNPEVPVLVEINLPEYLDTVSLLALERRMHEVSKACNRKLRLLAKTTNLAVEKYATRIFAECDDIYLTVDWIG